MKRILFTALLLSIFGSINAQDFRIPLEVNGGYINFDDDSRFKDTWYIGGAAGIDFTENAGIRGYYWRALDDGQIDEFDDLEILGAESKVKIPLSRSLKPYLVVGGGLLKPFNDYVDVNGDIENDDHFFGSAGAGLDLNFIRFISVTGYARAMISDFNQINTLENDINTSWNYGASINLNIGEARRKQNQEAKEVVMPQPPVADQKTIDELVDEELDRRAKEDRIKELEERIEKLEQEKAKEEERRILKEELREELMMEQQQKIRIIEKEIEADKVVDEDQIIEDLQQLDLNPGEAGDVIGEPESSKKN